jgi:hypothetical protein
MTPVALYALLLAATTAVKDEYDPRLGPRCASFKTSFTRFFYLQPGEKCWDQCRDEYDHSVNQVRNLLLLNDCVIFEYLKNKGPRGGFCMSFKDLNMDDSVEKATGKGLDRHDDKGKMPQKPVYDRYGKLVKDPGPSKSSATANAKAQKALDLLTVAGPSKYCPAPGFNVRPPKNPNGIKLALQAALGVGQSILDAAKLGKRIFNSFKSKKKGSAPTTIRQCMCTIDVTIAKLVRSDSCRPEDIFNTLPFHDWLRGTIEPVSIVDKLKDTTGHSVHFVDKYEFRALHHIPYNAVFCNSSVIHCECRDKSGQFSALFGRGTKAQREAGAQCDIRNPRALKRPQKEIDVATNQVDFIESRARGMQGTETSFVESWNMYEKDI